MTSFNLIPAHRREARRRRLRTRLWAISAAAYAAALLGGYALFHATWAGPDSALAGGLAETTARVDKSNRQIQVLWGRVGKARLALEGNRAVGDQPDWSVVLALLARSLDDELVLKRCKLEPHTSEKGTGKPGDPPATEPKRFTLEINGFGRSQRAISQFVLRLERTNLFEKVTLVKTNREPFMAGTAMAFQIRCLLGQGKGAPG